jgi:DNA-binding response OmpR family regulator
MFVVVATHNDEYSTVVRRILHGKGHTVFLVTTPDQFDIAMQKKADLYILDNFDPQDSGLKQAQRLHAEHQRVFWIDGHFSPPDGVPRLSDWSQLDQLPLN